MQNTLRSKLRKATAIILTAIIAICLGGCVIAIPPQTTITLPIPPITLSEQPAPVPIDPNWSPEIQTKNSQPLPSIADVVEKVFPAVVAINTETVAMDFFSRPQTQKGAGSGWVIDKNGIIVTNNHVVEGAKKVTIQMFDGRTFQTGPEKIYRDPVTDIAVIKIDTTNLPAAVIGDSTKLRVGEWVVALGNPLGNGLRAKEGTISGIKVSLMVDQGQTLGDLIETSAAINPGNSGGPLVNLAGQVIGITSAKMAAVGVEGMGYAISIKTAMPIIEHLVKSGYVTRPYLGIAPVTVDQYTAALYRLPVSNGVVIAYISQGGPADKAGLKKYDVITHYNNKEVTTADALLQAIYSSKIGEDATITFVRHGSESKTISIRLMQSPVPSN
jgi:serine protease Do